MFPSGVHRRHCIDHHGFAPLVPGGAVNFALAYLAHERAKGINLSPLSLHDHWFPYAFGDCQARGLGQAASSLGNCNASRKIGPGRVFADREVVWALSATDRCGVNDTVAHLGFSPET